MGPSRTHTSRLIDYSAHMRNGNGAQMLQSQIADFVRGIKKPRQNPVTEKQIVDWFRSTPSDFVKEQITAACVNGTVRCCQKSLSSGRKSNGAYVYEAVEVMD